MYQKEVQDKLVSDIISEKKDRISIFMNIPEKNKGIILLNLSKKIRKDIINKLNNAELVYILEYLDPDETTDLLQEMEHRRREKILKRLNEELREKVEFLLRFDPRTAAGVMSLDYIQVSKDITFAEISKIIQKHEKRTGKVPAILIVENSTLIGELPVHNLAIGKRNEKIAYYIKRVPSIKHNKEEKEIISVFKKHPHNKIVVLDEEEIILGVIYSDDILKIISKTYSNSLHHFAGVSEEEDVTDPFIKKVKNRYKWLILNLFTAFLAASVVSLFQNTISAFVLLAVYMPIVAGMGGNAGTQTLAVVIRGLTLKEVSLKTSKKVILNEIIAGAINGVIVGLLVTLVAFFWNKNLMLGLIIGLAMVVNVIIAGLFGAIIPLIMKSLGKDPASSSSIFITTATDVFGFFVFLGLASLLL